MGLRTLEAPARRAWPPLALCLLIVVSWAVVSALDNVVYTQTTVLMFLLLIVTLGLQIFSGNSGVLSFGHVAFVAIGAYTSALLTIPPEIKEFTYLEMPGFLKSWIFPAELGAIEATLAGAGFAAAVRADHGGADRAALGRGRRHRHACHPRDRQRLPRTRRSRSHAARAPRSASRRRRRSSAS